MARTAGPNAVSDVPAAHTGSAPRAGEVAALVTPVIVTYNSAHCVPALAECLKSYRQVIVSDNASADETVAAVRQALPQAEVLVQVRNLGFGAANNRALDRVETEFALLLNPDCTIDATQVGQLVAAARAFPDAAIIGPQILDGRGKAEINYRWARTGWDSRGPGADGPACVGFLSGAVMLLNMAVCTPHGFFDERFFLYYEDDDLCLKYFGAGHALIIEPAATAVHLARRSVKGKVPLRGEFWRGYHHAQSKLTYAAKYDGQAAATRLRRRLLWQTLLALPVRTIAFSPRLIARMWGRLRGVAGWSGSA